MSNFGIARYKGGWALVTGAARSQGLGHAFSRRIAAEGINLVLVDILEDQLAERAAELRRDFGVSVRTVCCDLGQQAPYPEIEMAVEGIAIDLLICNHMYTPQETPKVIDMPLEQHVRVLEINGRAYLNLMHRFAGEMASRGKGAVVVVASGAGLTSAPYTAAYSANKAYQIAYGEALWYELQGTGVDVLVVIGGLMRTHAGIDGYPSWLIEEPGDVAAKVLPQIGRRHMVVPGRANRFFLWMQTRMSTRRKTVRQIGKFMEKGLKKSSS